MEEEEQKALLQWRCNVMLLLMKHQGHSHAHTKILYVLMNCSLKTATATATATATKPKTRRWKGEQGATTHCNTTHCNSSGTTHCDARESRPILVYACFPTLPLQFTVPYCNVLGCCMHVCVHVTAHSIAATQAHQPLACHTHTHARHTHSRAKQYFALNIKF